MPSETLSPEEIQRYARHLALPEFGLAGQQALKNGKVLVVGAGGLGAPLLLYLAAAGVGRIGIVDFDRIDASNLQRQVLYAESEIGEYKAEIARKKLLALNSHIKVDLYVDRLTASNALEIIKQYDVVADGSDNFPTRYLVNDVCVLADKPLVYASIHRFEGQVSVFNQQLTDGRRGPNYRDLFPVPPNPELIPDCAEGGVLGVLPGIIGSMQANEVLKLLAGIGETLSGRLFLFDAAGFISRTIKIRAGLAPTITQLIDYDLFCNTTTESEKVVPSISSAELRQWIKEQKSFQLIDVREPAETAITSIGGINISEQEILVRHTEIEENQPVVFYCQSGKRSSRAIIKLKEVRPAGQFFNLEGGLLNWME